MTRLTQPFGRRTMIAGAAGLGIATVAGASLVAAQATPEPSDPATDDMATDDTAFADREAVAAERYDTFVTELAAALAISDTATVDTGIRTALTAMVEARLAAGEISADDAETLTTEIASAPAPLLGGLIAVRRGPGGRGGRPGVGFPGGVGGAGRANDPDDDDTDPDSADPSTVATPTA